MKIIENSVFHDNIGDIPRSDEEKLFHPITGMILARDMFGVSDDVAEAIRWHTTGKAGMSDLEKIIYLADYIEPSRELEGIEELRDISYKDLNAAMILGLHMSILDMETRGIVPNTVTYDALKDLEENL
jgi:nicotinate-nucleotide adenylyltransferase